MAVPGLSWSERALSLVQKMNNFYSPGSSRYQCRPFIVGGKEERSSAMEGVLQKIRAKHKFLCLEGWRDEKYDVKPNFYDQPLMCMERAATSLFGVKRYGVHVNGFTRPGDGQLAMWLGQRSFTKQTYPGLLDNMAAGGIPAQSGIKETLIRECAEEASIPMATAATAVPVSAVSYTHENELGIFPECQFVFDLEVPKEFEPTNADGEMQKFYLWPINKQDNNPKDTAKVIKNYLQRKEEQEVLEVMVWPPQSPDLNIIKCVWDYMKRQKDVRKRTSTEDLWLVFQDVWNNLPAEFLQKLCASVPRRIDAVLNAKGGHTKY
ncbi:thiamin pyrophosphokinase 2 isoform X2 [Erpetoichthys calabaricus]|uniref:thiamin pyrophosphokinase 2 isoform X2 n=1 Tax=Erpetoichthys calabaricus TaxID=27687 RepID=UPI00223417D9|nr:thiamin pyrophosphokinase 2 isoform X2 [Erpetoichthys calabaricus]